MLVKALKPLDVVNPKHDPTQPASAENPVSRNVKPGDTFEMRDEHVAVNVSAGNVEIPTAKAKGEA